MSDPSTPVLIFLGVFFLVLLALAVHSFLHHHPNSSLPRTDFGHLSTTQWNNPNITINEDNPPIELNNLPDRTRLTVPPTPHLPPPLPPVFYDFAIYEEPPSSTPLDPINSHAYALKNPGSIAPYASPTWLKAAKKHLKSATSTVRRG